MFGPGVLSVEEVERGPWLELGEETAIEDTTTWDNEAGAVHVDQVRDPPAGGVDDMDFHSTATITFVVAEEAAIDSDSPVQR